MALRRRKAQEKQPEPEETRDLVGEIEEYAAEKLAGNPDAVAQAVYAELRSSAVKARKFEAGRAGIGGE